MAMKLQEHPIKYERLNREKEQKAKRDRIRSAREEHARTAQEEQNSLGWLASTAKELNKRYRELRKDIRENTSSWSYSQYCERLANHYYNLACYCNDELFNKHKVDLESVKQYLEKCLEKLAEVSSKDYLDETKGLKNDAEKYLAEVNEIYEQQKSLLPQYRASNIKKYITLCIVLGHINHISLEQCSGEKHRRRIQNIQLLRVISMLEDAITLPDHKNTFITAEQLDYLGQVYQLAGQPVLSIRYQQTSDNLIKARNATKEHSDNKQEIKDIITNEIAEHKSNFVQVKRYIEETFHKSLSTIDDAYIEKKYVKYCARFWLQETTNFLKKLSESKSHTVLQEIFNSLDFIQGFIQIPDPLNKLEYYTLLMKHYKLVWKEFEKTIISRFKKACLEQVVAFSDSVKKELELLKTFVTFLSFSKGLQSIIAELELDDFCRGNLSFDEFINNILKLEVDIYGKNLTVLQEATRGLKGLADPFLLDKFKEVISAYLKSVGVQERRIDNRLVIEVTGKNIVVSDILQQLKNKLSEHPNIEEVRFFGGDIIHIDANFKREVWQGKNVVIVTKTIKVHDEVTWNVSGKDNNHTYSDNAGTGKDGHGKQGADGYAGESGGNVLILAEKIEGQENFTIISNGGKGSKGQDGGNGKDGKDGKGITKKDFNEKFPLVCMFNYNERVIINIKQNVKNIKSDSFTVKTVWHTGAYNATIENILNDIEAKGTDFMQNIFIETVTSQGNEVTFSYHRPGFIPCRQAFLLFKGSLGQPGCQGGEYGVGGQGGHAGEIIISHPENCTQKFNIIRSTKQGKDGENGKGGLYGNHGKNGLDMGYLDHKWWREAKFFDQGKYKVEYYDSKSKSSVWCPCKKKYASIVAANIEHKKEEKYEERKSARQNRDREHHAQAVRKKHISQSSNVANFSLHCGSIERSTLRNLQSDLENTKQRALRAIVENQVQQGKQSTELRISRHSTYQNKSNHHNDVFIKTSSITYKETIDVERFIAKLKREPMLLDNWFQLKNAELKLSQLSQLCLVFETTKGSLSKTSGIQNNTELQDIEKLLIDKYRLATLQEIVKQLPLYQTVTNNVELTHENAARYLIEAKESDNNISHHILGTLNQYLYKHSTEQHEKISKFGKEELQNTENKALKYSIRAFVLEVGKLVEEHTDIKKYYNEFKEFLKKQERNLNIFFEAFQSELSQPRHAEIFDLWINSVQDKSLISNLDKTIQEDTYLKVLYDRFNNQLELEYDWDKCCKDKAILKEFNNYTQEKGPLSGSYRELLAYIFGINIRFYDEDQENRLLLRSDHNPSSKQIIHMLCRENKFIQLNIDKSYLKLEEERTMKDSLYAQIFTEIKPFKRKQEFDDYLRNKTFLCNNSTSEDEQYFNEKEDIEKIIEYFHEEEKQQLKVRLNKITSQYIGRQRILHNMLKRFSSEGRNVSTKELYCLVNSILTFFIDDRKMPSTFCWIVAAHSQRHWIDELILLQLENCFKKQLTEKSKWREYLSKIENKENLLLFKEKLDQHKSSSSISTQCVENTLRLLSNIPYEINTLGGLELSELPYALKETYWTCKLSKLVDWQKGGLPTASYYLLSIENIFGTFLAETFIEILDKKKQKLSSDNLTKILYNFHNEKWNLSLKELSTLNSCSFDMWAEKMRKTFTANEEERKIKQLIELIKGNCNTSNEILNKLPKIENHIESIDKCIIAGKQVGSLTEDDIKNWVREFHGSIGGKKQDTAQEMLAVIETAIMLTKEIRLRDTQKLTVLALLMNDRNTLAQVHTGEGKSLIVVAASIMKALCGEKVDIITSSSVLAKRDAEDNRDIYNLFGINVSHNCCEDIEKRKEAYSGNQVVYGDLSNFQRDYLLDKFYGKHVLGDRNFNNVIVDEVDSMLLDKGNNMLYLSHDLAGLDKLESVYIYIWQWINRPARDNKELCYAFDAKAIKEAVISDLYGLVKKEDIGKLGSKLSEQQRNIMWKRLIEAGVLDDHGKLLNGNINDNELCRVLSPEFNCYKDRLHYLLKECTERETFIHVPNHLRRFIEQHLECWIKSAITAFFMRAGEDYVVDTDKTGSSPDRNPNITILDRDTGTDQSNSQWDEALHQFLQLKHGCKLSLQSLKAVFISNVSFFKLYSNLYGLSGTLGSQRERDLLQEIHKVDFLIIPTAKSKQFHEEIPILCAGKNKWIKCIYNAAKDLTERKKRSVLIICETVNDVETIYKAFGGNDTKNVHKYTRDYEEFDKEFDIVQGKKELGQGQIIIATNLAGRGTDIKISESLRKAGGLHVCITCLPCNIRIEQQAFGRAARNGYKGSGQLIIVDPNRQEYSNLKILELKKERDARELHRISDIKAYYETQITIEESCFKKWKEQYEQLKRNLDAKEVPIEVKEILLQSCLDKWAFWLDEHNTYVRDLRDEKDKRNLHKLLDNFISQLQYLDTRYSKKWLFSYQGLLTQIIEHDSTSWLAWVAGNPIQMIKLGKYLSQNEKHKNAHKNAIELFDEVIKKEPYFSEAAHYYKAFLLVKKIDWEKKTLDKILLKDFKKALQESAKLLNEHSKFAICAAGIIHKIKKKNNESIIQIDAYKEQQKSLANIYYMFSRSIDDIFGNNITPQSFVNSDINEEMAKVLYADLLREGVLKTSRLKKNFSEEELKMISFSYGASVIELEGFLSKYKGKEINEKEFQKSLKKELKLPDRKTFWKLLVEQKALIEEVNCVVVNKTKLKEEHPPVLLYSLKVKIYQNELEKQVLELNNEQILLNPEWITQQRNKCYIFKKDEFIKIVGKDKYKELKGRGVLSCNRKACVNLSKIEITLLSDYDSITISDFTKANINESEAKEILSELVERDVLAEDPKNSTYSLKIKFNEIEQVQLPLCSVYEKAVKGLLSVCFAYRVALQKISSQLLDKTSPVHLHLMTKPHQSLVLDLLEQQIIKPVTVAKKDKNLIEKIVREALNKLQLTKEDIIKNVIRILEHSRSSLKALKVPDGKLKPLTELCNSANIEEMHVFSLNGLDQLLEFGEKRWTRQMLINTTIVTTMGVIQIAISAAIEMYAACVMAPVGKAFFDEGVNDLDFAIDALMSGYFSWGDYWQLKLRNVMTKAVTVGIGALFSRRTVVSRFGYKLAGLKYEFAGKKVGRPCGTDLIKAAGWNVKRKVAKRITFKSIEGLTLGLDMAGVDTRAENYLQALCEVIASDVLSNIEQGVERHKISASLEKAYKTLGERYVRKFVNDFTHSAFSEQYCQEQYLLIANKIANSVTQEIEEVFIKRNEAGKKLHIHNIRKVMVCSEYANYIGEIPGITDRLLDNLELKIKDRLSKEENTKPDLLTEKQEAEGNYEVFKKEMTNQWKSLLRERAGQIIERHIVSPVLKEGANHLVRYVGQNMQEAYQSCTESGYFERIEELKQEYKATLQGEQQCDNTSKAKNHITENYYNELLKLLIKTKNPDLFADIVRENIPMDMICVDPCFRVVHQILEKQGILIPELTIIVEGDGGLRREFSFFPDGTEKKIITLQLKDNHFEFCRSSTSESSSESKKNCLYETLSEALPGLRNKMSPEGFRDKAADCIQTDKGIRYYIQQGWHRYPLSLGAIGGAKTIPSKIVENKNSSTFDVHNVSDHILARLTHSFGFFGFIQYDSENTYKQSNQVHDEGESQFQDKSSKKRREIHAAHVVRYGMVLSMINRIYNELYIIFKNFQGYTQNVEKFANEWHGVGGDIDNFQSNIRAELRKINLAGSLTTDDVSIIERVMEGFQKLLDIRIDGDKLDDGQISKLKEAKRYLTDMLSVESLFKEAKEVYMKECMNKNQ